MVTKAVRKAVSKVVNFRGVMPEVSNYCLTLNLNRSICPKIQAWGVLRAKGGSLEYHPISI